MGSLLAWRDSWLLGIEELDEDHFELVQDVNRLSETGQRLRQAHEEGRDRFLIRLQSVIAHLRQHFALEETFLRSIGYPGMSEHKREHALFLAELAYLHRRLANVWTDLANEEVREVLRDWFLNHIAEDRRFASYYFEQIGTAVPHDLHSDWGQPQYGRTDQQGSVPGGARSTAGSRLT